MIFIGLGGNLGDAAAVLRAALAELAAQGVRAAHVSPFYRSAPVPASDQPWFVNAVAAVETELGPREVMQTLLRVEEKFGRERGEKNAARTLDLDLLDYNGTVMEEEGLILPHPRMGERAFVLRPLADIAPEWRHPASGKGAAELLAQTSAQKIEKMG